jgi:ATP-dependent DNA helicase DinG
LADSTREIWGKISRLFEQGGKMSRVLPGFEFRQGQKEMAELVFKSLMQECVGIIEAGTGTGKTMAYLIPAVFVSQLYREPVVVATKTINLQEQIMYKDIPLLQNVLDDQFRAALVKGWNNYLCLRRMKHLEISGEHFSPEEYESFIKVKNWARRITTGDKSDIDFNIMDSLWEQVCAESSACLGRKCPWFNQCHFFTRKRELRDANILVTNHALLFTHIAMKRNSMMGSSSVLPDFTRLILDEAHHVEEVASNFLGDEASSAEFYKILDYLYARHRRKEDSGILARIRSNIFSPSLQNSIRSQLDSYCIPRIQTLREKAADIFFRICNLPCFSLDSDKIALDDKFKLDCGEIDKDIEQFSRSIGEYIRQLKALKEDCDRENENLSSEVAAVISRMEKFNAGLVRVWDASEENWIYSLEYNRRSSVNYVQFKSYPLNVGDILHRELFHGMKTSILTSATLSINKNFKYLNQRLGIDNFDPDYLISKIIDSPFDFKKQAVLAVPHDMPLSDNENFLPMVIPHLVKLVETMEGRTFLLFTSYRMLERCGQLLNERFKGTDFNILVQGESPRSVLLNKFKKLDKAVLLGTDSFWEGVDVPGRDLECVVLMKLPFRVPTDPVIKARTEFLKKQGNDPFLHYSVPQAVIRFKQGFGRLIRNTQDKGVIIVLDKRILEKSYGKTFLSSLPEIKMLKGSFAGIINHIDEWQKEFKDNPEIIEK